MANQSPTISIPKKTTEDVDWTTPIRTLIAQSYGENPDNYATECATLQRYRQDAVRGAGSEMTARDLLYKYFGQLELLELRFPEIRVSFPWNDAFTNKLTTQTSLAFEKASIIYQIAATHSAIAASQNRSDPEGLKRSFFYFRTSAGMLTYINENFLHAPSTDLSKEVVKFISNIVLAQATEVFFEKCVEEKKSNAMVAKIAAQTAMLYTTLNEEVKEFMGKGIFDRNWVTIIQIKSKYFTSLSQLYRSYADKAAGKHGDALSRITLAESLAKEASRTAASFGGMFITQMSPNLPPDAGSAIQELTKAHHTLCTEKKTEAQKENDLIYNVIVPPPETLPVIDKLAVATPVTIQEVYAAPDVQKTIGQDLFIKLVPLSVHESASVYSEEKAKIVRAEVNRADTAAIEVRSALDALGVKEGLGRFKAMVEGLSSQEDLPFELQRMKEEITLVEDQEPVTGLMTELSRLKAAVKAVLDSVQRFLDIESRDCESMRVKYDHLWTQSPSAALTKSIRQDLKSHFTALEAAESSDQQVITLWDSVRGEIILLLSPQIEDLFRQTVESGPGGSLLDLDPSNENRDDQERAKITNWVDEIEERLGRLNKISAERKNTLKDLKDKVQTDDVSHLLLLNRRNQSVEPTLFAAELEKFKPFQSRLSASSHHEQVVLQEISGLWKSLKDFAGRGPGARKWEEREKRKKDLTRRFTRARDAYNEVRDGLAKGLQFYHELTELSAVLKKDVQNFVSARGVERETIVAQAETQLRLNPPGSGPSNTSSMGMGGRDGPPPPIPTKPGKPQAAGGAYGGLDQMLGNMSLGSGSGSQSPHSQAPQPQSYSQSPYPPPPPRPSYASPPPPPNHSQTSPGPLPPPSDPYAGLFNAPWTDPNANAQTPGGGKQGYGLQQPAFGQNPGPQSPYGQHQRQGTLPPQPPQQQQGYGYGQPYQQHPQQQQHQQGYGQSQSQSIPSLPPPPPPLSYQDIYGTGLGQTMSPPPPPPSAPPHGAWGHFPPPPPQQSQQQYGGYGL